VKKFDTVRWGIIGVGNVTELKSGPAFYKVEHSSLVAVMRRDAEKAADYAKRHNISKWYSNASELINDPEVDAVYVATPPDSHSSYAIEVMRAGKPVYVEKPMARNYAECLEMLKVSTETEMPLLVAYYRRTLPAYLKVKELIELGTIGKPLLVNVKLYLQAIERGKTRKEMSWHVTPEISGAGHFFDLASHQFDYFDFVFGPVTNVKGIATNMAELYPAEDEIEIICENGQISFSCFSHGKVKLTTKKGITEFEFTNPAHISQNLVQQVVEELRGVGKCVSTGISAARTSRVLDEMVRDYYSKK
jgi:predicted dehydrogenase